MIVQLRAAEDLAPDASDRPHLRAVQSTEGLVELRPLVPEGRYKLRFRSHETSLFCKRAPKLTLWFAICDPDDPAAPHAGNLLARWYNVRELIGKQGKGGRFKAAAQGDLALEYAQLFRPTGRLDRISLDPFRESIVIGEVGTVTANRDQRDLPESCQYSVIRRLHSVWTP